MAQKLDLKASMNGFKILFYTMHFNSVKKHKEIKRNELYLL